MANSESQNSEASWQGELKKWTRLKMLANMIGLDMIQRGDKEMWKRSRDQYQIRRQLLDGKDSSLTNDSSLDEDMQANLGDVHVTMPTAVPQQPASNGIGKMLAASALTAGAILGGQALMNRQPPPQTPAPEVQIEQQPPAFGLENPTEIIRKGDKS